jgi:hypothetical protein
MLKKAMLSSARTSSPEKHKLLAEVISNRLVSDSESIEALVGSMAIDAISHLSSEHLRLLALYSMILIYVPKEIPSGLSEEEYGHWWTEWLVCNIEPLIPKVDVNFFDVVHLVSVSCATLLQGSPILKDKISPPNDIKISWDYDEFIKETDVGKKLLHLWDNGLKNIYLTSVGFTLALYVIDDILCQKTNYALRKI